MDFIPNLVFANVEIKYLVQNIALFFAEKDINIKYIKQQSNDIPELLKPYIALIYEKYIGLDDAISIVEKTIDYRYYDLRSSIYFRLLNKSSLKKPHKRTRE